MEQQRSLFFTAAVGLVVLAIIVASVYYLVKFIQSRVASSRPTPQASVEIAESSANPSATTFQDGRVGSGSIQTPRASVQVGNVPADKKQYNSGTFQVVYPNNWGLLTCTNSANFELDPLSPSDSSIVCDQSVKAITVLVDDTTGCPAETVKIGVKITIASDEAALKKYLKLYFETTKRQGYFGHNEIYHTKVWETFSKTNQVQFIIAEYNNTPLVAWMLLEFKDTLYYPYGGSSPLHRDTMASNLVAWEAIKLGKKLGLKKFDMWGALGPEADPKDSWYGFHKFKSGYGGRLVEYLGSFDLVSDPFLYYAFSGIDKFTRLKVLLLRVLGR